MVVKLGAETCSDGKTDQLTFCAVNFVNCPEIGRWPAVILYSAPIADRISHRRFEEISRYLHFVDESLPARGAPGYNKLQNIKPVVEALRERFSAVYHPQCQLSVDEAMIPFKGRYRAKHII